MKKRPAKSKSLFTIYDKGGNNEQILSYRYNIIFSLTCKAFLEKFFKKFFKNRLKNLKFYKFFTCQLLLKKALLFNFY